MVKGVIGAGSGGGRGTMHDEDWGLGPPQHTDYIPYSNTLSDSGYELQYFLVDAGYDIWRTAATKIALFGGYSYFRQYLKSFGCKQIADPHSDCSGRDEVPTTLLALTDTDTWRALRLGAVLDTLLAPGLKLTRRGRLPPLREGLQPSTTICSSIESAPEWGDGAGVQLEAMLSYALTSELSVGVGGRYWSMWANGATDKSGVIIPMHFAAEQAALLVQGSYTFDMSP